MRIEVRRSDAFTRLAQMLYRYADGVCYVISRDDTSPSSTNYRANGERDISHEVAFELMRFMGHDPVYVDEAVPSPDPHAEWREAVTEWARTVSRHIGYRDVQVAFDRVGEAAERAKKEAGR